MDGMQTSGKHRAKRRKPIPSKESKKEKGKEKDCISRLPDHLFHHILSFLPIADALATSLVSRRWRNLWKHNPNLDFTTLTGRHGLDAAPFIDKALSLYESPTIRTLRFEVFSRCPKDLTSQVSSWIKFAVRHRVQELEMKLFTSKYSLPPYLVSCTSLHTLRIHGYLTLRGRGHASFNSLRTLSIKCYALNGAMIRDILSGSPVLEDLSVKCYSYKNLINIGDSRGQLRSLDIRWKLGAHCIKVFAPKLLRMGIGGPRQQVRIHSPDSMSLIGARFDINSEGSCYHLANRLYKGFESLLKAAVHAKDVCLGNSFLEVFASQAAESSGAVSFNAVCLELKTTLKNCEIKGIANLLRRFGTIETLKFITFRREKLYMIENAPSAEECWESMEASLSGLDHLKAVEICCVRNGLSLLFKDSMMQVHELSMLVKLVLKNLKQLKRLTISVPKEGLSQKEEESEFLPTLSRLIASSPKACPDIEVVLS